MTDLPLLDDEEASVDRSRTPAACARSSRRPASHLVVNHRGVGYALTGPDGDEAA